MNNDVIKRAPNRIITKQRSDNDCIVEYLLGKRDRTELSEYLQLRVDQMYECSDLIRKYGSRAKVAKMLITKFGITKPTAYKLFSDTQQVFGSTQSGTMQFHADILVGFIMKDIRKARKDSNWAAVARMQANYINVIEKFMGNVDVSIYDNIQPVLPEIGFFPDQLAVKLPENMEEIMAKLMLKKKKKVFEGIEEAEIVK